MIITETITINGKQFTKNYSDEGFYIQKVGTEEIYSEAVDPVDSGRTYIETTERMEEPEFSAEDALDIIVGGEGV